MGLKKIVRGLAGAALIAVGVAVGGPIGGIIASQGLGVIASTLQKKQKPKTIQPEDLKTEQRNSDSQRVRILGRARASGVVLFYEWAQVGDQRALFKLIAVGQGGISGYEGFWLDEAKVEMQVDYPSWVATEQYRRHVQIQRRTGLGTQSDGGQFQDMLDAFPGQWTNLHRVNGVGCLMGRFLAAGGDDLSKVYPGGTEPKISALVRGSQCYRAVADSYTWSDNPSTQLQDVFTHPIYGAVSRNDLHLPSFTQAEADCNDIVPSMDGDIRRYWSGGGYALNQPLRDIATPILDACAGELYQTTEGKIGLRVGKWREPIYTILPEHIVSMEISPGSGDMAVTTTVIPSFTSPLTDWQTTDADAVDDNDLISVYGDGEPEQLDLTWVQHHGQARYLAQIYLAKKNPKWRATIRLRWWGLLLMEQENVRLALPEVGAFDTARITGFEFDPFAADGVVTVELSQISASAFDRTAAIDGTPPSAPATVSNGTFLIPAPVITSLQIIRDAGPAYFRVETQPISGPWFLRGRIRAQGFPWVDLVTQSAVDGNGWSTFVALSGPLADNTLYDIELAYYDSNSPMITDASRGSYIYVQPDISVVLNPSPPSPPYVIGYTGSVASGSLSVNFAPNLGANYWRTGLYRAGPSGDFADAVLVGDWNYEQSSSAYITVPITAAGRYWIASQNASQVQGAPALVGTITS